MHTNQGLYLKYKQKYQAKTTLCSFHVLEVEQMLFHLVVNLFALDKCLWVYALEFHVTVYVHLNLCMHVTRKKYFIRNFLQSQYGKLHIMQNLYIRSSWNPSELSICLRCYIEHSKHQKPLKTS